MDYDECACKEYHHQYYAGEEFKLPEVSRQFTVSLGVAGEPFLIQEGYLMRTPRGREVTDLGYAHLGKFRLTDQQPSLF